MRKKNAKKIVTELAQAAGHSKIIGNLAKQAIENFQDTPESEMADLFVVFLVDGKPFVRSTHIRMEKTWREFWDRVSEWALVEIEWHCDDQKFDYPIRKKIIKSINPELYWINFETPSLTPVKEDNYLTACQSKSIKNRQFAFLTKNIELKKIDTALRKRISSVHGWKVNQAFTRPERSERPPTV